MEAFKCLQESGGDVYLSLFRFFGVHFEGVEKCDLDVDGPIVDITVEPE